MMMMMRRRRRKWKKGGVGKKPPMESLIYHSTESDSRAGLLSHSSSSLRGQVYGVSK